MCSIICFEIAGTDYNHGSLCLRSAVLFIKPPSSAVLCSATGGACRVSLPRNRGSVHYECEVILRLGPDVGIADVSLGLDLTLREVQAQLKKSGHAWEISKVCGWQRDVVPCFSLRGGTHWSLKS